MKSFAENIRGQVVEDAQGSIFRFKHNPSSFQLQLQSYTCFKHGGIGTLKMSLPPCKLFIVLSVSSMRIFHFSQSRIYNHLNFIPIFAFFLYTAFQQFTFFVSQFTILQGC